EVASAWRRTNLYSIPIGSNIPVAPPRDFNRDQARQRLDVQQGDLLLGYFGMLNESKGVETLLEAVALVRGQGLPVKLVLIGDALGVADATNVASSQRIDARIKELGLGECVKRTGALPPDLVSAHLLSLDLCVL